MTTVTEAVLVCLLLFVVPHHTVDAQETDDTINVSALNADCAYGNHRLYCTAWGRPTFLHTTVIESKGATMSCASIVEREDRCYAGIKADTDRCCLVERAEERELGRTGICGCSGDFPTNADEEGQAYASFQSHSPKNSKCLYSWAKDHSLRPCKTDDPKQQWRLISIHDRFDAPAYKIVSGTGEGAKCLYNDFGSPTVKKCDKSSASLWHVSSLVSEAAGTVVGGAGFYQFKSVRQGACLQATSDDVKLRSCDGANQSQWWMLFEVEGPEKPKGEASEFLGIA
ncbi:unnamed protein product [Vitrella brassicaformis CCMP3155]|uniref:Uncharacterized protein n=1 Tax=Vitrella brassicaformis (strain CCMP3155) TaxID=1169540 RepID=A0A0G4F8R4_VITBC|nr:unnamed protein product [Vitrella brassicaformis CCMP3155]|mmetsp:Transcript_22942/g.56685  ORF Transcript_22942/g.56685 Transcript_22942/m.56685 type:complete len:284 (-) Transcript_22942:176-1027(-)|eukprot:CEM09138.1 unnamed protein product [Vitrella brassicaformis CCMP3155]